MRVEPPFGPEPGSGPRTWGRANVTGQLYRARCATPGGPAMSVRERAAGAAMSVAREQPVQRCPCGREHVIQVPHRCDTVYGAAIDLHTWMLNDVADVRRRLHGVLDGVPTPEWTRRVAHDGPSLPPLALHLTRHQDLAVSTVIRNRQPLYLDHRDALGLADAPVWADLAEDEDPDVINALDLGGLVTYVDAVFSSTGAWLDRVGSMALDTVPDTAGRLRGLAQIPDELDWLVSMWSDRPVWWLLQWPVVGHGHAHVGQAGVVRNVLGHNPF